MKPSDCASGLSAGSGPAILTQVALARDWDLDWLYLGLAIRENRSMAYKLAFMPHERRVDGVWQRFSRR